MSTGQTGTQQAGTQRAGAAGPRGTGASTAPDLRTPPNPWLGALLSEWRRLTATPTWWILGLVCLGYMGFLAGLLTFASTLPVEEGGMEVVGTPEEVARTFYALPVSLGYVFPLVAGSLAITSEFRHRTLPGVLLADPSRSRLLTVKLLVQALNGAFLGLCGVAGAIAASAVALLATDQPTALDEAATWRTVALVVLALALWGMVGVGFGALVPQQVAAVVCILAFTQLIEPMLRIGLAVLGEGFGQVGLYFPGAAAEALVGESLYSVIGAAELLSRWEGGLVLLAYALVFAVLARFTTLRRDVG